MPPRTGSAQDRTPRNGEDPVLGALCRALGLDLVGGEAGPFAGRPVRGVWQAGRDLEPPSADCALRDLLVVPPEEIPRTGEAGEDARAARAERFVRRLGERGAAGIALPVAEAGGVPEGAFRPLAEAAGRLGVAVVGVPAGLGWPDLAQAVGDERVRLARRRARVPEDVLARLRTRAGRPGGVQRLVEWLADAVGGAAVVVRAAGGPVAAAPEGAWEAVREAGEAVARVADGRLASAVVDAGPWVVRVLALGEGAARPVLAVARPRAAGSGPGARDTVPEADARAAAAHAAGVLPLLLRVEEAHAVEQRNRRALEAANVGVLQMLMGGQLTLARRTAAAVRPGLLDAEEGRVLIVSGRPEGRTAVVEECVAATAGRALIVRCPVYDADVIVVAPDHAAAPEPWEDVSARLRDVVTAGADRSMGGSALLPLGDAAGAYREASHALAVARHLPERVVLRSPEVQLADVLDARAVAWAAGWLAPLLELPYPDRGPLLDTLRLVLEFGVSGASRISGRHRNTVAAARRRAADLLGADLDDVAVRARLDLALRLLLRLPAGLPTGPAAALPDVLACEPARWWARRWLAALEEDGRDLRETLTVWIACNAGVAPAAERLGLYPGTVRDRLRAAGCLLHRDLMTSSGPHDVVLALLTTAADGG